MSSYLANANSDASAALSQALHFRKEMKSQELAAEWLINFQGAGFRSFALKEQESLGVQDARGKKLVAELRSVRSEIAMNAGKKLAVDDAEQRKTIVDALSNREATLQRQLAGLIGDSSQSNDWATLQTVQQQLKPNEVLIHFAKLNRHRFESGEAYYGESTPIYAAWIVYADRVQVVELGDAEKIENVIGKLQEEIKNSREAIAEKGERAAEKQYRETAAEVGKLILEPLLPHIQKHERWLIAADAAMWLVPWSTLPLDTGYVVEKHAIRYLVSGRDLLAKPNATIEPNAPVIFADPDFNFGRKIDKGGTVRSLPPDHELGEAPNLPSTRVEAMQSRPHLERFTGVKSEILLGDRASVERYRRLKSPRILIMSTHGYFTADSKDNIAQNPLIRSGLLLASSNSPGGNRGVLTGLDVLQTDLRGTELVVLSACDTALGKIISGNGVAGLRQAFQLAGAEAVIATLWKVEDASTARYVERFFVNLATNGDKTSATQNSQRDIIAERRTEIGASHPYYWGAFTLTGQDHARPKPATAELRVRPAVQPATQVEWWTSYDSAVTLAEKANKPLAVVIGEGAQGYLKIVDRGEFSAEAIAKLNEEFICVYLDINEPKNAKRITEFTDFGLNIGALGLSTRGAKNWHRSEKSGLTAKQLMVFLNELNSK